MSKKILFLSNNLNSGGAERQMVTIACLLKNYGYEVELLCYTEGDFYKELLAKNGIPIYWLIFEGYFKRVFQIRKFIRKNNYDVVISFLEVPNFMNCVASIGGKKWKVVIGERSSKERTFKSNRGKIFAWFYRYADKIVCNSNNARKMWNNYFPRHTDKLYTIYNSVQFIDTKSSYSPIKDGKVKIVIAASFQYLKNMKNVILALSLLNNEERKKIEINWYGQKVVAKYGDRPYQESVALVKNNNLEGVVNLHGPTKNIANIMYEADFVGLFSELEGLPNSICEGMMLGKPILMTRVSDYYNLINGKNGFLCDWDNVDSIKDAFINAISTNEVELLHMGSNSKKIASELFSEENILTNWLDIIN